MSPVCCGRHPELAVLAGRYRDLAVLSGRYRDSAVLIRRWAIITFTRYDGIFFGGIAIRRYFFAVGGISVVGGNDFGSRR